MRFLRTASMLLLVSLPTLLAAQSNYIASEIPAAEWPDTLHFADVDGDGRTDIVIPYWSPDTGRQLHIYQQQDDRRYPAQPTRIVDIRPEIVAVTFADLRPEPGEELLLLTGTTVFSLSTAESGYAGNIRRLFDWPLIAGVPDKRMTRFLPRPADLSANGFPDLLLPGPEGYAIFAGTGPELFELRHQFSTINDELDPSDLPPPSGRFNTRVTFDERDGLVVSVVPRSGSAFVDFLDTVERDNPGTLLASSRWMPPAILADMTARGSQDIVYLNIGNDILGQLNILRRPTGDPAQWPDRPQWQGALEMRGDFHLMDVNGDGLTDVVRIVESSDNWDVSFYVNKGGRFDLQRPDQVMRFSGYDLRLNVTDIMRNGRPQLSVSYYTIPVVNAIRNTSIVRTQLLYGTGGSRDGQLFNSRPDYRLDENFSASSVRGLSSPIYLEADLNRNGRADALYLTPEGTLAAKTINDNLQFSAQPFWQHVPSRTIVGFEVMDMNGDGIPDIILNHSNTTTVLVSAP
jgi:hypothetical protein